MLRSGVRKRDRMKLWQSSVRKVFSNVHTEASPERLFARPFRRRTAGWILGANSVTVTVRSGIVVVLLFSHSRAQCCSAFGIRIFWTLVKVYNCKSRMSFTVIVMAVYISKSSSPKVEWFRWKRPNAVEIEIQFSGR